MPPTPADRERKQRILAGLRGRRLEEAADPALHPDLRADLDAEAASAGQDRLVTPDLLAVADAARAARPGGPGFGLLSTDDVILVPGFLASQLTDAAGGNGWIYINPALLFGSERLMALELAADTESDAAPRASVGPDGVLPVIYAGLRAALEFSRYHVVEYAYDWRKDTELAAARLADLIRGRLGQPPRPLHVVAHSQGSLVARRALQLLGPTVGRQLVNTLVLLGPATAGSFSAAFGIAGSHELLETVRRYGITPPAGFGRVLRSLTGMYQLLPWRAAPVPDTPGDKVFDWLAANPAFRDKNAAFWKHDAKVDTRRLDTFYGWAERIDASYLHDHTTIILGDAPTVGGAKWDGKRLVPDPAFATSGDGTVPDALARIAGVTRMYKAAGAEHMMLPATWTVIQAVRAVLAGRTPRVPPFAAAAGVPLLADEQSPADFFGVRPAADPAAADPAAAVAASEAAVAGPSVIADVSPPPTRRLRVFSFDPLFGSELGDLSEQQLTVELPWEFADGDRLRPGPVGEYLEVVDHDPGSGCFYPPVDLNHPHLLAQDGIPVSEGDPRFHQQMVYAVAMSTIRQFEQALGRTALWAPRLVRDAAGNVIPPAHPGDEYVGRLRVYPHALRQANAYYDPDRKALLFGYFTANGPVGGRTLPGGTVFGCLSFDIVAHETTHALLDGLHRYFTQPSNPDVYAFHEAFADLVALLQHFSHPAVLKHEIARTRGDLGQESTLGALAAQFGQATGRGGALRRYLGERGADKKWRPVAPPDEDDLRKRHAGTEPHARGAVLVAAVFRAFVNIYESRVADLRRIATGGSGIVRPGELHPDLRDRLADEAATAARHTLRMCVRGLDYLPPVDVTFGEYLRAVVTADYDLVRDDDRRYRVAMVSAFRDWGIYPAGVRSLSVDGLLWGPPEDEGQGATDRRVLTGLRQFFDHNPVDDWAIAGDRRATYLRTRERSIAFHDWLQDALTPAAARRFGLALGPDAPGGISRKKRTRPATGWGSAGDNPPAADEAGRPVFEVHSMRPCRRIGPDGQQLTDVLVELVQKRQGFFDEARQAAADAATGDHWNEAAFKAARPDFWFRGGCTLILDPETGTVRYAVRKSVTNAARLAAERAFRRRRFDGLAAASVDCDADANNPFAALHDAP